LKLLIVGNIPFKSEPIQRQVIIQSKYRAFEMVKIALKNLKIQFDDFVALHNISVEMEEGKITTLLGPSGCGKTTTLRSIAGFNDPVEGQILFDEEDMVQVPPQKRDAAFVFQNYALWPHMNVFDNIAYGLKLRDEDKPVIKEKVLEVAQLVDIVDQLEKKPTDLSGGQQQRVALARALVVKPQVLLCDEPLSNLDAKLRLEMRIQVRRIVNELGLSCIWVTHDQDEALSLSDHIIVMDQGKIKQSGDPVSVYLDPENQFVAEFMGEGSIFKANVINENPRIQMSFGLELDLAVKQELNIGDELSMIIRPEYVVHNPEDDDNLIVFDGTYLVAAYMGKTTRLQLKMSDGSVLHYDKTGRPDNIEPGKKGTAGIKSEDILIFHNGIRVK
jgi:iron(III) transport system ATP-binding protein